MTEVASSHIAVRVLGPADWYDEKYLNRTATRFPRYHVETRESPPRRGSIASYNQDDDEAMTTAFVRGVAIEVDRFRIHWLP